MTCERCYDLDDEQLRVAGHRQTGLASEIPWSRLSARESEVVQVLLAKYPDAATYQDFSSGEEVTHFVTGAVRVIVWRLRQKFADTRARVITAHQSGYRIAFVEDKKE